MNIKKIFTLTSYTYFLLNFLIVFSQNKKVVEPINLNGITADYVNEIYGYFVDETLSNLQRRMI